MATVIWAEYVLHMYFQFSFSLIQSLIFILFFFACLVDNLIKSSFDYLYRLKIKVCHCTYDQYVTF
jgi:hypothetical protein